MKISMPHFLANLSIITTAMVGANAASADSPRVTLYHNPGCMCCEQYAEGLEKEGYAVKVIDTSDLVGFNERHGVRSDFSSCHTSLIGDYVVVGHVPYAAISELLRQRPDIRGLALPGMPTGSPGMPGFKHGPFDVRTLDGRLYGRF